METINDLVLPCAYCGEIPNVTGVSPHRLFRCINEDCLNKATYHEKAWNHRAVTPIQVGLFAQNYIAQYFKVRGLTVPNLQEAVNWLVSEVGEVSELMNLVGSKKWVRNSDVKETKQNELLDNKKKLEEEISTELGDVIFMAMVASMTMQDEVNNAFISMFLKMNKKMET